MPTREDVFIPLGVIPAYGRALGYRVLRDSVPP
jgi:hypothetical protein